MLTSCEMKKRECTPRFWNMAGVEATHLMNKAGEGIWEKDYEESKIICNEITRTTNLLIYNNNKWNSTISCKEQIKALSFILLIHIQPFTINRVLFLQIQMYTHTLARTHAHTRTHIKVVHFGRVMGFWLLRAGTKMKWSKRGES